MVRKPLTNILLCNWTENYIQDKEYVSITWNYKGEQKHEEVLLFCDLGEIVKYYLDNSIWYLRFLPLDDYGTGTDRTSTNVLSRTSRFSRQEHNQISLKILSPT